MTIHPSNIDVLIDLSKAARKNLKLLNVNVLIFRFISVLGLE